jgi:CPA2 family monovalent cation:H+ antiporter-2
MLAVLLTLLFRYSVRTALLTGALLAQAGEFSFVLATLGSSLRAVTPTVFSLLLAGTALSIVLSPTAYRAARPAAAWLERHRPRSALAIHPGCAEVTTHELHGHAVVCGHGRVGAAIVTALRQCQIPLVTIERDHRVVRQLRAQGMHALLGDAANPVLLEQAHLEEAAVLILAIPDALTVRQVVAYAHRMNPQLEIVARTHSAAEEAYLRRQGVGDVVLGELELALGMARYTLRRFGVGEGEADVIPQSLRGQERITPPPCAIGPVSQGPLGPGPASRRVSP